MKRILPLILASVLILGFAGCEAEESAVEKVNGGTTSETKQSQVTDDPQKPNETASSSKTLPVSYPKEILPLAADAEIIDVRENPANKGLEVMYVSDNDIDTLCDFYEGAHGGINLKAEVYNFRANFYSSWGYVNSFIDKEVTSNYSDLVTLGNPAGYRGASDWAKAGLDKAALYGFITDKIKDNMSGSITREEFAEVAVKLYELYTGKKATAAPSSTFTDTANVEILKAYQLGIVSGIGNNKFAPKVLINREQMAAMLSRAVEAIKPDADMSIVGAPTFADEKEIAPYFIKNVQFMAKNGFISGVGNNRFAPKATSTREQAVIVAVRVYETYAGLTE